MDTQTYNPTTYPSSGSTIDRRIRSGLSTQITVFVNDANGGIEPVGAIQSLTVTENNTLKRIGETRSGRTVEIIPQGPDMITLNVRRMIFDNLRLIHALGRGYTHIRSQRVPFDIAVFDKTHTGQVWPQSHAPSLTMMQTWYRRCWFSSLNVDYRAQEYLITENATLECEYIEEIHPITSEDNERGLQLNIDHVEQSYDEGLAPGGLDTARQVDTTKVDNQKSLNSFASTPAPIGTVTPGDERYYNYTVAPGETLGMISNKFGVTVETLAQVNEIANTGLVQEGSSLLIPV